MNCTIAKEFSDEFALKITRQGFDRWHWGDARGKTYRKCLAMIEIECGVIGGRCGCLKTAWGNGMNGNARWYFIGNWFMSWNVFVASTLCFITLQQESNIDSSIDVIWHVQATNMLLTVASGPKQKSLRKFRLDRYDNQDCIKTNKEQRRRLRFTSVGDFSKTCHYHNNRNLFQCQAATATWGFIHAAFCSKAALTHISFASISQQ